MVLHEAWTFGFSGSRGFSFVLGWSGLSLVGAGPVGFWLAKVLSMADEMKLCEEDFV